MNASSFHFCGWWDSHFFVSDHAKKVVFQKQIPKTTFEACLKNAQNLTLCRFSIIGYSKKFKNGSKNVFKKNMCFNFEKRFWPSAPVFDRFWILLESVTLKKMKKRVSNCFLEAFLSVYCCKILQNFVYKPCNKVFKFVQTRLICPKTPKTFSTKRPLLYEKLWIKYA